MNSIAIFGTDGEIRHAVRVVVGVTDLHADFFRMDQVNMIAADGSRRQESYNFV